MSSAAERVAATRARRGLAAYRSKQLASAAAMCGVVAGAGALGALNHPLSSPGTVAVGVMEATGATGAAVTTPRPAASAAAGSVLAVTTTTQPVVAASRPQVWAPSWASAPQVSTRGS